MGELETELLSWSTGLEGWQRDLLRRVAQGGPLARGEIRSYADEVEWTVLEDPAKWFESPIAPSRLTFTPLAESHLQTTSRSEPLVSIQNIEHVEGVNDLAPGATLEFATTGLTILAGRNGSGKSGYTRILKQVAATRAPETVLPNAYRPGTTPKANITFGVGTVIDQELRWQANVAAPESPLQRVRVFDSRSAMAHLSGSSEIAYVPPTLQILAEYTAALREIGEVIADDLRTSTLKVRSWPQLQTGIGSEVFDHLGQEVGHDALLRLTSLSEQETLELSIFPDRIQELTVRDPARLAVQARSRAAQFETLARKFEVVISKLDLEHVRQSELLRRSAGEAEAAVIAASHLIRNDDVLPNVGSPRWRDLWIAAKEFVEEDVGYDFPDLGDGAVCALCQQELDDVTRDRFSNFDDFMRGEAQLALEAAIRSRKEDVSSLEALPLNDMVSQDLIDLVKAHDEATGDAILPVLAKATALRDSLIQADALETNEEEPIQLVSTVRNIVEQLRESASVELDTAVRLEGADSYALEARRLVTRMDELTCRQGIKAEFGAISAQHDLAITMSRLEMAIRKCDTTLASRENTKLSKDYVDRVCASFAAEANSLGLNRVPVELVFDRSSRGVSYVRVSLAGVTGIPIATVLSEGEQRIAAIAGFFADLTESGDESTLVFDDPVSSLDQVYREAVALRLLIEAEHRQVLVFTHDFTFVQYLYEQKQYRDIERASRGADATHAIGYVHIDRSPNGAGQPTDAEQWRHVSIAERLRRLNVRIENSGVLYRNGDVVAYEKEARDIVGAMRDTWEYFVELELLDGVVKRHERGVQTKRLKNVVDISDTDVATVDLGMNIESRYLTGHSAPTSDQTQMKDPAWLNAELAALTTFRGAVMQRRTR